VTLAIYFFLGLQYFANLARILLNQSDIKILNSLVTVTFVLTISTYLNLMINYEKLTVILGVMMYLLLETLMFN